jgi:hypothetical protein
VFAKIALMAVGVAIMTCEGCAKEPGLARLLPTEIRGWKAQSPDGIYNSENLYDYIDGAAEVYRSFNVQTVVARRYAKEGAAEIVADLFDMGSSQDAFGAYHHDVREGAEAGIGQDSEHMTGYLSFWKGRYFVSILTFDETEESKLAMLDLGKAIAAGIADEGTAPDLVKLLPEEGRLSSHVHYFHNHLCLNAHYYLADENLLKLDMDAEGIMARYRPVAVAAGEEVDYFVFVLIRYPSAEKAKEAYRSFLDGYLPDADVEGAAQTENSKWAVARLKTDLVMCVFDAPSKTEARRLMNDVKTALAK